VQPPDHPGMPSIAFDCKRDCKQLGKHLRQWEMVGLTAQLDDPLPTAQLMTRSASGYNDDALHMHRRKRPAMEWRGGAVHNSGVLGRKERS
jgi:hypothetical protein